MKTVDMRLRLTNRARNYHFQGMVKGGLGRGIVLKIIDKPNMRWLRLWQMGGGMQQLLAQVANAVSAKGWMLATAESCTGGGIAEKLTTVPGASTWYSYSVVSYSNEAKQKVLGVKEQTLSRYGAVSQPVAEEMAQGVARLVEADVAISVTGIAGPGGGTAEKPVGTVCIGWFVDGVVESEQFLFVGDRESVRYQSIYTALQGLLERIGRIG